MAGPAGPNHGGAGPPGALSRGLPPVRPGTGAAGGAASGAMPGGHGGAPPCWGRWRSWPRRTTGSRPSRRILPHPASTWSPCRNPGPTRPPPSSCWGRATRRRTPCSRRDGTQPRNNIGDVMKGTTAGRGVPNRDRARTARLLRCPFSRTSPQTGCCSICREGGRPSPCGRRRQECRSTTPSAEVKLLERSRI